MTTLALPQPWKQTDAVILSGRYLAGGLLFGFFRILWLIGASSGLFGTPPDAWIGTASDLLALLMYFYAAAGVINLFEAYRRYQSLENLPIAPFILNWAGVLLMLAFAERVDYVTSNTPQAFVVWASLATNGLVRGGVYALIALGYTLVYGILFMINFAHGEIMMFGAFAGFIALQVLTSTETRSFETGAAILASWLLPLLIGLMFLPLETLLKGYQQRQHTNFQSPDWLFTFLSSPVRFIAGVAITYGALVGLGGYAPHVYLLVISLVGVLFVMVCGMVTSMLLAALVERVAYKPLRKAPRLAPLISAIGASIFLQQAALRIFGPNPKTYPTPKLLNDPKTIPLDLGTLGTLEISKVGIVVTLSALALMFLLYFIVNRTKMGKAMKAVSEDKNTAALMGINVDQVILFTFMLGAALAGAGGVMLGFRGDNLSFSFGFTPGLKAFTAAVLGGIGNIPGAMFGGFFLGLVEALVPLMLGIDFRWQDGIAFGLLVLILIFRPTGILGGTEPVKKV